MTVDTSTELRYEQAGQTYYFCCESCRRKFADKASGRTPEPAALPPSGGFYFCPMCPGVRSSVPAACPICGMALEPETPAAGAVEDDSELRDFTRRLIVATACTIPLVVLAMAPMLGVPVPESWHGPVGRWLQLVLSTPVVLWCGWPFFVRGARSLVTRHFNMFTLIGLGTGAAYAFSVAAVLVPNWVPATFREHGHVPLYFESAAVIIALVLLGQVLEQKARRKTSDAVRQLLALAPPMACRMVDGREVEVPLCEVVVGDLLRVRPGEKIPVDAQVVEGHSAVDESLLTGESISIEKGPGEPVIGGTLNGRGTLVVRARRVGQDTLLAQIIRLVGQAQRSRAPIQRVADVAAAYFVPAVVSIAIATFVLWMAFSVENRWANALTCAVAVLIIACPCALGLATPMSIMVGIGRGAREGILIRDAEVLERLEQVDTVLLDKTGTLTMGRPRLERAGVMPGCVESDVLRWAAAVEHASEHPLASAVLTAWQAAGDEQTLPTVREFAAEPGAGVRGVVDGQTIRVGTPEFCRTIPAATAPRSGGLVSLGLVPPPVPSTLDLDWGGEPDEWQQRGATVLYVAAGDRAVGWLAVSDPIRPGAREALDGLRALGLRLVMLTGDTEPAARTVGRQLGIDQIEARQKPQDKIAAVRRERRAGHVVLMTGDGVNDAPALAAADVGVALGAGSDVAIESAAVTLMHSDLAGLVSTVRLGRQVMRNIRQNLWFAFAYNAIGIPIAAGVLAPLTGLTLSPMIAAAAMSFSSVSVILNALRLRRSV